MQRCGICFALIVFTAISAFASGAAGGEEKEYFLSLRKGTGNPEMGCELNLT